MEYFKKSIFRDKKCNQKYKQEKGFWWNKKIKRMLYCRNQLLRKAFLSLLAILWYSAFKLVYISFSPLLFASLLFTAIWKGSLVILLFKICFSWGWSWLLSPVQCHEPPSIVHQALYLSDLITWIYLSLPLYSHKGFDLGHTWMV